MAGLSWECLALALGNCEVIGELPGVGVRFHIVKCGWELWKEDRRKDLVTKRVSLVFTLIIFTDDLLLSC